MRRAPWLDGVPPATRELMQAMQVGGAGEWRAARWHGCWGSMFPGLPARGFGKGQLLQRARSPAAPPVLQAAASAAVVDFDAPGAAWRCTPKALLAAGLLAEEAAKLELAARFPQPQAAAPAGGAGQVQR